MAVYGEMMLTVASNYSAVGNVLDMTVDDIEFFYDGLRATLKKATKPVE